MNAQPAYEFGGLSREVLRHWLRPSGRLPRVMPSQQILRAGLLTDLYLSGRIWDNGQQLTVDTADTSDPATNRILAAVERHPARPMFASLARGPAVRKVLVESLLSDGTWQHRSRHRYRDLRPDTIRLHPLHVDRIVTAERQANPYMTCMAILIQPALDIDKDVYPRCGPAATFLREVIRAYGAPRRRYTPLDAIAAGPTLYP